MNREIRVREVRVIGPEGEQLGILPTPDAFRQAQEGGYDLVEVAPTSVPPVCRIMDYGKYKYELSKKDHQSRGGRLNRNRSDVPACGERPRDHFSHGDHGRDAEGSEHERHQLVRRIHQ